MAIVCFVYGGITLYAPTSQQVKLQTPVHFIARPTTLYEIAHIEFGLFPFRSPLLRKSL